MMSRQPRRARSELLGACRQAFQLPTWRAVPEGRLEELSASLVDEVFGFGPLEPLLADPTVTEIMVNGPQSVFFERGGCLQPSEQVFSGQGQLRALIDRVLGPLGRRVDESSPMVNARMPEGHRVNVVMPPLAPEGPIVTIRKFAERVMTLEDMVAGGSLDNELRQFLEWAVRARKNVVVAGGTGSGKTTLLNALSCCIPAGERIVTIEDTAELRFLEHPHVVRLEARPRNAEGVGEVTIPRFGNQRAAHAPRPHRGGRMPRGRGGRHADRHEYGPRWVADHVARELAGRHLAARGDDGALRRRPARRRDRGECSKRVRRGGSDDALA